MLMKGQNDIDDLVLRYIFGQMDDAECKQFEDELNNNPELQNVYKLHLEINKYIDDHEAKVVKDRIIEAENHYFSKNPRKIQLTWFYRAAIFILLLTSVGIIYWLSRDKSPVNSGELYSQFYEPYDITIDYRSDINLLSDTFRIALEAYDNKAYQQALPMFEFFIDSNEEGSSAHFFAGICSMEMGQFERAINHFQELLKHHNMMFQQQASWYLALCYLKTNQKTHSKRLLNQISKDYKFKKKEAGDLLDKL